MRSIPDSAPGDGALEPAGLFQPVSGSSKRNRFVAQARQIVTGSREGGFFLMIGRRPS